MKRRDFIADSIMVSAGITSVLSCQFLSHRQVSQEDPSTDTFALNEVTIDALQEMIANGQYSYEKITSMYLKRIEELDKNGPAINSIIELNPDALKIAAAMDSERKSGKLRSRLHGIPVIIKDNIDTADRMMTTAGSLALVGHRAKRDAFIVKKMRDAGAVIIGKANLSEWANFRSLRSSSGWSSRGGQTRNPYVLDRTPCGSSSGSAAAVAANLCMVAVGTETNGSIACPASMNSIVGIKPTVGLVSRSGIIPISKTQDTAGPMARTVKDAAILLGILTGVDPDDVVTTESAGSAILDYTSYLNQNGLTGKRIGVEKSFLRKHEQIDNLLSKAINQMKDRGAIIAEVEFMDQYSEMNAEELILLEYEFKDGLNRYLASSGAGFKSLQEIIDFNTRNEANVMPYFKQELFESSQSRGGLHSDEYLLAVSKLSNFRTYMDGVFEDNHLDALCGPATGLPWCIDPVNGDFWTGYGTYGPAAVMGYPSVTVPMGNINNLPVGISFIGKAYDEPGLIAIGYAYERASKNRIVPNFKENFSS